MWLRDTLTISWTKERDRDVHKVRNNCSNLVKLAHHFIFEDGNEEKIGMFLQFQSTFTIAGYVFFPALQYKLYL